MSLVIMGQCYTTKFCVQIGQSASEAMNVLKKLLMMMNVYPEHKFIVGILDFKQFHKTLMLNQEETQEHQTWLIVSVT